MNKKSMYKYQAAVAFAVVLAFIMPGSAAFANVENETLGVIVSETSEPLTTDWWPKFHHDLANTGYSTSTAPGTPINSVSKETDSFHVRALSNDLLIPSDIINNANTINDGPGPGFYDTSEYMIGSVAVGVLLLESNGSGEPSTETWTVYERIQVTSEIQEGLNWWKEQDPNANVNFVYDWNYGVPVSIEPINHPSVFTNESWEEIWVDEAMAYLGYNSGNRFFRTRSYLNDLRTNEGTDWSFAVFVIDSSNDADGRFSDGYFAWGYFGGPFIVMTYDNDGWEINNMSSVVAHETGHIFYAADEYYQAGYGGCTSCTDNYGYLGIANSNCEYCAPPVTCLMNNGTISSGLCSVCRQQVGWRDTDGDGIHDIVDTNPQTTLTPYSPDPTSNDTLTYTGSSAVVPYTNNNPYGPGNDVSIDKISNVKYRVDGGTWTDTTASDGAFDEPVEDYTFTASPLSPGTHTIEAYSINSVGNLDPTPASDTITIDLLDQSQDILEAGYALASTQWLAQSFKPSLGTLTRIELLISREYTTSYSVKISIRDNLLGNDIVSVTKQPEDFPILTFPFNEWTEIDFPDTYVFPEETYYIVCTTNQPIGDYNWFGNGNNLYERGQAYFSFDQGSSWVIRPTIDLCFKTYGIENQPPNKPTITGPTSGNAGTAYPYSFISTDLDGDEVSYYIEWGDGDTTTWTEFRPSGPPGYSESHSWNTQGTYIIRAKAKDIYGAESEWGTLSVTMPLDLQISQSNSQQINQQSSNQLLLKMVQRLLQNIR